MSYHNIITAYDGSKASEKALSHAIKLIQGNPGSKLTVANVLVRPAYAFAGYGMVIPEGYEQQIKDHQNSLVDQAKAKIADLPYAKVVILSGTPATAILDYAKENMCDLIVMGNRGLGPIREWMLGSVSHHVAQLAQIPVLIVK
ncbi:universal stress protein [Cohnella herbarum]|uniref:Universal stress protein n=1 Tax=Cohnella herbarum TaxID=2728023 RepID=A0A7Z2VH52_9BACL|nr:universal stress protein [Cohnella herbarum]QJD82997.1 universal stress protein [Cohnella herbarum]